MAHRFRRLPVDRSAWLFDGKGRLITTLLAIGLFLLGVPCLAFGQEPPPTAAAPPAQNRPEASWSNLESLAPGQSLIFVRTWDGKKTAGQFAGFDETSITLRKLKTWSAPWARYSKDSTVVPRDQVSSVKVQRAGRRAVWTAFRILITVMPFAILARVPWVVPGVIPLGVAIAAFPDRTVFRAAVPLSQDK